MISLAGCASHPFAQKWTWSRDDDRTTITKNNESKTDAIEQAASVGLSGKTLWLKPPKLNDCEYDSSQFPTFSQVEVANVTASVAQPAMPTFRIAAQLKRKNTEGQLTFIVFERTTEYDTPVAERCFYDFDPKKKYKMSASEWELIAKSSYRIGFSPAQLQLSIGEPEEINRTVVQGLVHEQWVYDKPLFRGYIYFENGKLKSWQD
jgi:hypothetical protein